MLGWFKKKLKKKSEPLPPQEAEKIVTEQQVNSSDDSGSLVDSTLHETLSESQELIPQEDPSQPESELEPVLETEPEPETEPELESEPELEPEPNLKPVPEVKSLEDSHDLEVETPVVETEIERPIAPKPIKVVRESEVEEKKEKKKSLFSRLTERLGKTRETFTYQLDALFLGKKEIDTDLIDDLEEILIGADLGVNTTQELIDDTRRKVKRKELSDPESLKNALKDKIKTFIQENEQDATLVMPDEGPFVIMVIGVNGVGKTTTIGKIAYKFKQTGHSVMLVAADTFRAAAVSQLKIWGERNNVEVVAHKDGADPSSVIFDALGIAEEKEVDVVLVDTAGRMHTKDNLMEELKKIKRVMNKKLKGAPHEIMLVLDATTGQNGISQARLFDDAVGVTGLTLTKLDGTSKGGIVANICREMQIPIRFIGIGEQLEDLRDFNAEEFIDALFHSGPSLGQK